MMSDASDPVLNDFIENIDIGGESGRMVLHDKAGTVLVATAADLQASYQEGELWVNQILEGVAPYHFQLLGQSEGQFSFKISIPVKNNESIEGVLSAEITESLDRVFCCPILQRTYCFQTDTG